MSAGKVFFDTNVLLYLYSGADLAKQAHAQRLALEHVGRIVVSTQVVQEFYTAGRRKIGMPQSELEEAVQELLVLPLVMTGPPEIRAAIRFEQRYRISFWDALIVAAAESGGADMLFTEDLNDGQQYGSVMARNPFRM